jgi:hydroxymethylbilane synthase
VLEREDPRDALVSPTWARLEDIPAGSVIGTSSLRRQAQVRHARPDLVIEPVRGNVETRLRKLDEGRYAAIVLAAAGLKRLRLTHRIAGFLPDTVSLPAVGQGAVGVECLIEDEDTARILAAVEHPATRRCVDAERGFAQGLEASCESPIAGYAVIDEGTLHLRGLAAARDGSAVLKGDISGPEASAGALGAELAEQLLARGAAQLLAAGADE